MATTDVSELSTTFPTDGFDPDWDYGLYPTEDVIYKRGMVHPRWKQIERLARDQSVPKTCPGCKSTDNIPPSGRSRWYVCCGCDGMFTATGNFQP